LNDKSKLDFQSKFHFFHNIGFRQNPTHPINQSKNLKIQRPSNKSPDPNPPHPNSSQTFNFLKKISKSMKSPFFSLPNNQL
jgi:hypothetical protein